MLLRNRFAARVALAAMLSASASAIGLGAAAKPALYTDAQAATGATEFATHCSACHGDHLEGGAGPALSGATLGRLATNTKLTVGDMFTFSAQLMPLNEPASLKRKQYVDIMAFILKANGYPAGPNPLTYAGAMNSTVRIRPK